MALYYRDGGSGRAERWLYRSILFNEFKKQMVQLYNAGRPRAETIRKYNLTGSAFKKWVKRINATGSTKEKDNRTPEEAELLRLLKENY